MQLKVRDHHPHNFIIIFVPFPINLIFLLLHSFNLKRDFLFFNNIYHHFTINKKLY